MVIKFVRLFSLLVSLSISASAYAVEPAFCELTNLKKMEVKLPSTVNSGLRRAHMYQIGSLKLLGLGVGGSKAEVVKSVAQESGVGGNEKYCTWYFNDGNQNAQKEFHHRYVDRPNKDIPASVAQYDRVLNSSFDLDPVNFLYCAEEFNYVAMGCDGQKHRGPTVVGMFLSFAGCSPEKASAIVNKVWGLNTIPEASRLAVIRRAYEMGNERPLSRERLLKVMTTPHQ